MRFLGMVACLIGLILWTPLVQGDEGMIAEGKKVKMEYTLTVEDKVVDTSEGREPLEFTQGQGMLIPGLEKELEGMKAGEAKSVTVAAAEGYGDVVAEAVRDVPTAQLPPEMKPELGMQLGMQTPDGRQIPGTITEIKDDVVVVDFNHPLAGKELNFDVEIVSVE